jgi:galactose oxidase-like protein/Kelch motif protein
MRRALESSFLKVVVLVFAAQLLVTPCRGQDTARFVATWPMKMSRSQHTATLLTDGRVLLAGGTIGDWASTVTRTTEIFDPATGTFSAGPDMLEGRRMHSATLLADGRVLITGGFNGRDALSSAELYDPSSGRFFRTGDMIVGRGWHDAILLPGGAVLVVGGNAGFWPDIPGAEIFYPAKGTFATTGAYVGRGACDFCPPSVALGDGRILFTWQNPAQIYDPATAKFTATGEQVTAPSTAAVMLDGRVLFTGGEDIGRSELAAVYHPVYGTFTRTGNMSARRVWHSLTLLPDGTVLAAGGETDACTATSCFFAGSVASAELYNPWTGGFTPAGGPMISAREGHTATLLNDGRVLLAGGVAYGGIGVFNGGVGSAELYTPSQLIPAPMLLSATEAPDASDILDVRCMGLNDGGVLPPQVTVGGRFARILSLSDADSTGARVLRVELLEELEVPAPTVVQMRYIGRTSNEVIYVPSKRRSRWAWSIP